MSQIVVPAAARSVIAPVAQTTFQVGTYSALADTFTKVVDLNDHVSFWLVKVGLAQPEKVYARTSTIRAAGERITAWNYKNRHVTVTIQLLYQSGTTALLAAIRALLSAIENPPYRLAFAPPNAGVLTYADVVAVSHTIPSDAKVVLAKALNNIAIDFECAPGFSGDRITLSNLVVNPGFEAPAGPGISVLADQISTLNAYTTLSGSPTLSSNNIICPANAAVLFGSPVWGAFNTWQCRFNLTTGATASFYLHYVDASNWVRFDVSTTTYALFHQIGGVVHTIVSGSVGTTLSTGSYYWVNITQFPAAPGTQPDVAITINNDSTGAIGTVNTTVATSALFSGSVISGKMGLLAQTATVNFGGFAGKVTNTVSLFGPGGWFLTNFTNNAPGAWDQTTANTYPGGATTSYGAARIDAPRTGAWNAGWTNYTGGAPTGTNALPAPGAGNALAASAWVKTSGLAGSGSVALTLREWDASGASLRQTTLQTLTGNQASWTQMSGTVTTGANTAYVDVILLAMDTTSASANAIIWFDNAQCWNQTTTGQTVMPYCELRFPQSPAQLLVTGLQGDMVAPAALAWGTYLASWGLGATLSYALGRRAQASANAQLAAASIGFFGTALSPTATAVLDSASYGGFFVTALMNPSWNPRAFSFAPSDALGVYHLFSRFYTAQSLGNLANVQTRVVTQQKSGAWFGALTNSDQFGAYYGPLVAPLTASTTWTPCDSGQANVPALPVGATTDLTQNYLTPRAQWGDNTGGGSTARVNWQLLLPVDGAALIGTLINASNAPFAVTTQWLWSYLDGLLVNRSELLNGETLGEGATYSLETAPTAAAGHAGGGAGTTGTGAISINNNADPYLTLDPNISAAAVSGASGTAAGGVGVNQFAGFIADNAGTVLALHAEMQYTPLYLYPREQ
jgi:hypothetical protein